MASESQDEVRRRVASLYDRAENATGNFNATRAMASGSRGRGGRPRGATTGSDPVLDDVARQWFDVARARFGPTVPAVLPDDRLPRRAAVDRPRGAAGEGRTNGGGPAADRALPELPAGPSDRALPELPSGGPARPLPELPSAPADGDLARQAVGPTTNAFPRPPAGSPLPTEEPTGPTGPTGPTADGLPGWAVRPGPVADGRDPWTGPVTAADARDPWTEPVTTADGRDPWAERAMTDDGRGRWTEPMTATGGRDRWAGSVAAEQAAWPTSAPPIVTGAPAPPTAPAVAVPPTDAFPPAVAVTPTGAFAPAVADAPAFAAEAVRKAWGAGDPTGAARGVPGAAAGTAGAVGGVAGQWSGRTGSRPRTAEGKARGRRKLDTARGLLARRAATRPSTPAPGDGRTVITAALTDTGSFAPVTIDGWFAPMAIGSSSAAPYAPLPLGSTPAPSGSASAAPAPAVFPPQGAAPAPVAFPSSPAVTAPAPAVTAPAPAVFTPAPAAPTPPAFTPPMTATAPAPLAFAPPANAAAPAPVAFAAAPVAADPSSPPGAAVSRPAVPASSLGTAPGAGKAVRAVAFARAQVGKPCLWGATGPDSYDHASLVRAAWLAAGVTLPRSTRAQAGVGTPVAPAGLHEGDLVFFFDDDRHVGIYVGAGMMVHAPGPGALIREESIYGAGESAIHRIVRPV